MMYCNTGVNISERIPAVAVDRAAHSSENSFIKYHSDSSVNLISDHYRFCAVFQYCTQVFEQIIDPERFRNAGPLHIYLLREDDITGSEQAVYYAHDNSIVIKSYGQINDSAERYGLSVDDFILFLLEECIYYYLIDLYYNARVVPAVIMKGYALFLSQQKSIQSEFDPGIHTENDAEGEHIENEYGETEEVIQLPEYSSIRSHCTLKPGLSIDRLFNSDFYHHGHADYFTAAEEVIAGFLESMYDENSANAGCNTFSLPAILLQKCSQSETRAAPVYRYLRSVISPHEYKIARKLLTAALRSLVKYETPCRTVLYSTDNNSETRYAVEICRARADIYFLKRFTGREEALEVVRTAEHYNRKNRKKSETGRAVSIKEVDESIIRELRNYRFGEIITDEKLNSLLKQVCVTVFLIAVTTEKEQKAALFSYIHGDTAPVFLGYRPSGELPQVHIVHETDAAFFDSFDTIELYDYIPPRFYSEFISIVLAIYTD